MPSKSRQRQLARLAARRQAERRKRQRTRIIATVTVLVLILAVGGAVAALTIGGSKTSSAPSSTPTIPTSTPTVPVPVVACGGTKPAAADTVSKFNGKYPKPPAMTIDTKKKYLWTLDTVCGTIQIELTPSTAPKTVNSLVFLTKQGLFDGGDFHRIAQNFVIQGGDPLGTGTGGPGYTVVDTPPKNAQYPVGTVAMAKGTTEPNGTAGSQFFIVTSPSAQTALAPSGTGQYAIAGHVVKGLSVVNTIAAIPIQPGSAPNDGPPAQAVYILKATVTVEK